MRSFNPVLVPITVLLITAIITMPCSSTTNGVYDVLARILVDNSRNPDNLLPNDLEILGFDVHYLNEKPTPEPVKISKNILSNYDILVISSFSASFAKGSPSGVEVVKANYTNEEIQAIRDFVINGGGLLVFISNYPYGSCLGGSDNLNEITSLFGINYRQKIEEPISDISNHPLTLHVEKITLKFCHLIEARLADKSNIVAWTISGKPAIIALEYGKGRVVIMATMVRWTTLSGLSKYITYRINDLHITREADNLQLLYNILCWLVKHKPTDITPYTVKKILELTSSKLNEIRNELQEVLEEIRVEGYELLEYEKELIKTIKYKMRIIENLLYRANKFYGLKEYNKSKLLAEEAFKCIENVSSLLLKLQKSLKGENSLGDLYIRLNIVYGTLIIKSMGEAFPEIKVFRKVFNPLLPYINFKMDFLEIINVKQLKSKRPAIIVLEVIGDGVGFFRINRLYPDKWNLIDSHWDFEAGLQYQNYYLASYRVNTGEPINVLAVEITYLPWYISFRGLLIAVFIAFHIVILYIATIKAKKRN